MQLQKSRWLHYSSHSDRWWKLNSKASSSPNNPTEGVVCLILDEDNNDGQLKNPGAHDNLPLYALHAMRLAAQWEVLTDFITALNYDGSFGPL